MTILRSLLGLELPNIITMLATLGLLILNYVLGVEALRRETENKREKLRSVKTIKWLMAISLALLIVSWIVSVWSQLRAENQQRELQASVTGGDNFVDIDPTIDLGTPEQLDFMLLNPAETPQFDVQTQINDQDAAATFVKSHITDNRFIGTWEEFQKSTQKTFLLGTVHGKTAKPKLTTYALGRYQSRRFFIDTWARNGYCRDYILWCKGWW